LFYLQTVVGDIELFEKFFHDWVNKVGLSSIWLIPASTNVVMLLVQVQHRELSRLPPILQRLLRWQGRRGQVEEHRLERLVVQAWYDHSILSIQAISQCLVGSNQFLSGHLPVPPKYDTTLSEASTNLAKKYEFSGVIIFSNLNIQVVPRGWKQRRIH
jgi:hypothetical protein